MSSSGAVTSTTTAPVADESPRPHAPPLPRKVGEIGYVPPAQSEPEMREVDLNEPRPARHPADHDPASSSNPSSTANLTAATATTATTATTTSTTTEASQPKKDRSWMLGGISIWSFARLFTLFGLMAGTGVAWWYTVQRFQANVDQGISSGLSSTIFVHVAFTVISLFEFIFLERCLFHIRAERYMFKHGMPMHARRAAALGITPWNRPSLPTYAAALAESGHGTGDVEDNLIAIIPPPAYGNTRGSVLLLSSMLPSSLIRSLSRISQRSQRSTRSRPRSQDAEVEEGRRSRPVSYGASEEIGDAARARELENSLAQLENTSPPQQAASLSPNQ